MPFLADFLGQLGLSNVAGWTAAQESLPQPITQGVGNGGGPMAFPDPTGEGGRAGGALADESEEDVYDLLFAILSGANDDVIRAEARRRGFRLSDFNAVTSDPASIGRVAMALGFTADMQSRFMLGQLLNLLEEAMRQGRGRKRGIGLKTMMRALEASGKLAAQLRKSGRGIASLYREKTYGRKR